ncbi:hypothetical protein ABC502_02835 [Alkalimonas sp. NCh-2]|uniref:hypothetical protein n=1 Tax=Alkalimonas sp. NCh-2 TaxID=3144846 RepID=UPI0031F6D64B
MLKATNYWLLMAAAGSFLAALAHLGCIVFGGDWYRFFGAGEQMALMAEAGHWQPAVVTSGIVLVLLIWSAYALSGAGVIRRLPLLRTGLLLIGAVLLMRGLGFVVLMPQFPDNSLMFWLVSSGICLVLAAGYLVGLKLQWPTLKVHQA